MYVFQNIDRGGNIFEKPTTFWDIHIQHFQVVTTCGDPKVFFCKYLDWGKYLVNILLGGNILWISWLGATSCEYLAWGQHHVNILIGVNILWISCLESIIEFVQEYLWTMERNLEAQLGVLEKGGRQYWFGQCLGQYLGQYLFWKVFGQYLFGQYLEQYWGNADFGQYWWRVVTMFRQYWLRQRINNIYLVNVGTIFNDIVTIFV